jgi:hypothetical protein
MISSARAATITAGTIAVRRTDAANRASRE